jgi:hypothetical protein
MSTCARRRRPRRLEARPSRSAVNQAEGYFPNPSVFHFVMK